MSLPARLEQAIRVVFALEFDSSTLFYIFLISSLGYTIIISFIMRTMLSCLVSYDGAGPRRFSS